MRETHHPPVQAMASLDPMLLVEKLGGHRLQFSLGLVRLPPAEYIPIRQKEHELPPRPAWQMLTEQEVMEVDPFMTVVLPEGH